MSPGYGRRIYRKRKIPAGSWLIITIAGIAFLAFMILVFKRPVSLPPESTVTASTEKQPPSEPEREDESAPADTAEITTSPDVVIIPAPNNTPPVSQEAYEHTGTAAVTRLQTFLQARDLYINGLYQQALELLQPAGKNDLDASLLSGLCYFMLEDYAAASTTLMRVVRLRPDHFLAAKFLALSAYKTNDLSTSKMYLDTALGLQPDGELQELQTKLAKEMILMKDYTRADRVKFSIQFSMFEHNDIKEKVENILLDAYQTISNAFHYFPEQTIPVILYNEQTFFDITRAPGWAGGLYDGKIRLPVKNIGNDEALLRRVLYHEFSHAFMHSLSPVCPLWLNEGLAEYFSRNSSGEHSGQIIPISRLNDAFRASDARVVSVAYRQSFSLVSDLVERYGLYRLKEALQKLNEGLTWPAAFRARYFIDWDGFASTWRRE